VARQPSSDPPAVREDLCRRCGKCCYEKLRIGDEVVVTSVPCPYLDTRTNLCTVYAYRHRVNARCLSVEEGIRAHAFPADCPYVRDLPGYRPPLPVEAVPGAAELVREAFGAAAGGPDSLRGGPNDA